MAGGRCCDGAVQVPAAEALAGKIVALYFSASWCPPCKLFTPVLKAAYEAANKAGKRFEVRQLRLSFGTTFHAFLFLGSIPPCTRCGMCSAWC